MNYFKTLADPMFEQFTKDEKPKVDRDLLITQLVDDDINRIINDYNEMGDCSTLAFILDEGFAGYRSYTDEQLMQELEERDISYLFGETE